MNKTNYMALNYLMRNIDLKISNNENQIFENENTGNALLISLAVFLRNQGDVIHSYYIEEREVLEPWPLSINSYAMSFINEKSPLISTYTISENEEDFNIKLNIEIAKNIIKKVQGFAKENEEHLLEIFCFERERKDLGVKFN